MSTTESGRNPESANAEYLGTVSVIERLHCRVRVPRRSTGNATQLKVVTDRVEDFIFRSRPFATSAALAPRHP